MTIRKGQEWATPIERPTDLPIVATDVELAGHDPAAGPVGLAGGDLFRTLGEPEPRPAAIALPVDRLRVTADGAVTPAIAHVVVRRPGRTGWWRGPLIAVCNIDYIGQWNVAPRAHPNDGRFDVIETTELSMRDRWAARQRLPQGTHVPHPAIHVTTATQRTWEFERPMSIVIDGRPAGTVTRLEVSIEPDALTVVV